MVARPEVREGERFEVEMGGSRGPGGLLRLLLATAFRLLFVIFSLFFIIFTLV